MALRLKQEIEHYIENKKIDQLLKKLEEVVTDEDFPECDILDYVKLCKAQRLKLFENERAWDRKGLLMRCLEEDGREDVAIELLRHEHATERATDQLKPFILHVAVARRRTHFIHQLLDQLTKKEQRDFVNLSGTDSPETKGKLENFEGKTPVCIAARNNDLEMIQTLFKKGANLEVRGNTAGNNAVHSVLGYWKIVASQNLEGNVQNQQDLAHVVQELLKMQKDREGTRGVAKLLFHKNDKGFTPLLLATQLGAYEVVRCITTYPGVYKILVTNDMLSKKFAYDVTEIDSVGGGVSVLQLLQGYNAEQPAGAFDIIGYHPIRDVLKFKWSMYGKINTLWLILHVVFMGLFTIGVTTRKTFEDQDLIGNSTNASFINATQVEIAHFLDSYEDGDWIRPISEVTVLVYASVLFVLEICAACDSPCPCGRRLNTSRPRNVFLVTLASDTPYRIWFMLFIIACFAALVVRVTYYHYDNHTISAVLVSGWWCTLQFPRGLCKSFSVLTTMIDRIIFHDLAIFFFLYYLVLFGFSFSMDFAFTNADNVPHDFKHSGHTVLTMFKLSLGLTEVDVLQEARHPSIAITIYVIYTVIAHVLLLNLLLTMFTESHDLVKPHKRYLNQLQRLSVIQTIEKRLPSRLRKQCYLSEEEKSVLQKNKNYQTFRQYHRQYIFIDEPLGIQNKFKRAEKRSRSNSDACTSSQVRIGHWHWVSLP